MSLPPLQRHVCRVADGWLHYRRMGSGPPVLLLHQTPQSSQTLEPLMRLLAPHATAIAVDTPGFGQSDPLAHADWTMPELADRMAAFLDAIGVGQVAVCGQHTGASIGAELARRHPQRVSALALDGVPLFNAQEQRSILPHQLYRFVPQVDGTHLMWAWSRFRDGWLFFPWSQRDRAHRRVLDLPDARVIHEMQILELLRAREHHLRVYPGVFAWDGAAALSAIAQPMWIGTTADDQLAPHLQRLPTLPAHTEVRLLPIGARAEVLQAQARWVLGRLPAQAAPPAPPPLAHWLGPHGRARAHVGGLSVQGRGMDRAGTPRLLLHGAGSAAACELLRAADAADGPLLAVDLPGHGDAQGAVLPPAAAAEVLAQALDALELPPMAVHGRGYGAAVATEWALRRAGPAHAGGCRPLALTLHEVVARAAGERADWAQRYAAPIEPAWDGSHLIRLWHEIRDRELFHPWFERSRHHIRPVEPLLDAESLTRSVFAALCCQDWPLAHRLWLAWPPERIAALAATGLPVTLAAADGDGWAQGLAPLRAALPQTSGGSEASSRRV